MENRESKLLCDMILKKGPLESQYQDLLDEIIVSFIERDIHSPYDEITRRIFELKKSDLKDLSQSIKNKLDSVKITRKKMNKKGIKNPQAKANKITEDILRHCNLAILQKEQMNKLADESKDLIDKANNQVNSLKQVIYTDFVSILGIFTAITFATFGGLQLLGNVFGNIKDISFNNIGGVLILGSVFIGGTYLLLITLFSGISKISNIKSTFQPTSTNNHLIIKFCKYLMIAGISSMLLSHWGVLKSEDSNNNYNIKFTDNSPDSSANMSSKSSSSQENISISQSSESK